MSSATDARAVSNPELVAELLAEDPAAVRTELHVATLLVPATPLGDGQALVRSGRTGTGATLLWAFTDLEALAAWDRHPVEHAIVVEGSALAGLPPAGGAVIAVNAAGPGAFLVDAQAMGTPTNGRVPPAAAAGVSELVDADTRRPLRTRASAAHDMGRRAASAGDLEEACNQFERSIDACGRLGDRLHGAAAALELASTRQRAGSVELAVTVWERAAETLALLGEGDLAIGALLDAAQAASAAGFSAAAERLSVSALELGAGTELAARLVSLWGAIDGR